MTGHLLVPALDPDALATRQPRRSPPACCATGSGSPARSSPTRSRCARCPRRSAWSRASSGRSSPAPTRSRPARWTTRSWSSDIPRCGRSRARATAALTSTGCTTPPAAPPRWPTPVRRIDASASADIASDDVAARCLEVRRPAAGRCRPAGGRVPDAGRDGLRRAARGRSANRSPALAARHRGRAAPPSTCSLDRDRDVVLVVRDPQRATWQQPMIAAAAAHPRRPSSSTAGGRPTSPAVPRGAHPRHRPGTAARGGAYPRSQEATR